MDAWSTSMLGLVVWACVKIRCS